jgi:hypothetical protein
MCLGESRIIIRIAIIKHDSDHKQDFLVFKATFQVTSLLRTGLDSGLWLALFAKLSAEGLESTF